MLCFFFLQLLTVPHCIIAWTQDCWYSGSVTRYHRRKDRHRVEYDDGDHEWINFTSECERVQVQQDDGLWTMVRTLPTLQRQFCVIFYILFVFSLIFCGL